MTRECKYILAKVILYHTFFLISEFFSYIYRDSLLLPPHFNASQSLDGVSGLDLIPFIYDIRYSLYPPLSLGLSDIGVVDTYAWTEIHGLINITCGVCDDMDFSGYCEYTELIGDTILLEAQYRKWILMHEGSTYWTRSL